MNEKNLYSIVELIKKQFTELIESTVYAQLRDSNYEYRCLWEESCELSDKYPIICKLQEWDGEDPITLSAEEGKAFSRYYDLKMSMTGIELMELYFRGHRDCHAFTNQTGVV